MSSPPVEKKLSHVVPVVVFIFPLIHGIFTAICYYKGRQLQKKYRMDVVVGDIIVELKSVSKILEEHGAQLFNYLSIRDSYGQECPVIDRNLSEIFIYDYSWHIHGYS